jgi:Protein of unknown function VcgC/VcgE (DUF2780)
MTRQACLGIVVLVAMSFSTASVPQAASPAQAGAASADAAVAAKASPELIGALSKEMGATPEQAAGAAGTLFGVAKSRLKAEDFSQIATAVPGMDSLLKAAPSAGSGAAPGGLSQLGGGASGLASAASAFSKLGLSPDMVSKAVPVLTSFVTKSGGSKAGSLLAGALK